MGEGIKHTRSTRKILSQTTLRASSSTPYDLPSWGAGDEGDVLIACATEERGEDLDVLSDRRVLSWPRLYCRFLLE